MSGDEIPGADQVGTCQVCQATPGRPCRGVDTLPLPSAHPERTAATPMFDELLAGGAA
jgi:hypothetical protein